MTKAITLVLLPLVAVPLAAQSTTPEKRAHHSLVYDEASKRVVLYGGSTPLDGGRSYAFFNDMWTFDGARWTKSGESGDRRSGVGLAFDTKRNRIVSFGGFSGAASLSDLRSFDGHDWLAINQHPEVRAAEAGFVYDPRRDRFVTIGGSPGRGSALGDTWEYDNTTWHKVAGPGPAPRQGQVMVFDSKRNRVVLFGGNGSGAPGQPPPSLGDTWEYDGLSWKQVATTGPAPRGAAGGAFDSKRGRVIIFGGAGPGGFLGDTWSWDGTSWKKLADSGPEPRAMGYIAYDKSRDRVVLFGGRKGWPDGDLNDTWEWDGAAWKKKS